MRTNWVREKLRAGQPTFGCFTALGSPNVAELLAVAGFDWLVIDTEHTKLDTRDIQGMLMAIQGTNTIPIVRVSSPDPVVIQQMLDIGAMGIAVPRLKTAAEARAVVVATRYPPKGIRGFGPLRAAHWTLDHPDYLSRIDDNVLVILILETHEAVGELDAIMSVEGIDALYFGGFDLSLSMGLDPLRQPHPEIEVITERAIALGRTKGVAIGDTATTPDQVKKKLKQGMTLLGYAPDFMMLVSAAKSGLDAFNS